jgi:spermidine synthase
MNVQSIAPGRIRRLTLLAVGSVGFAAIVTQLVLMRELLAAFSGNELVFGLVLGLWLLLTGIGTWVGRIAGRRFEVAGAGDFARPVTARDAAEVARATAGLATTMAVLLVIVALLPPTAVAAVRGLRDVVFPIGAAIGVGGTTAACATILAPFCLASGAAMTLACGLLAEVTGGASLGRVYIADAVGGVIGGVVFGYALVPWLDHFALLACAASPVLLVAGALASAVRWRGGIIMAITSAAALAWAMATLEPDRATTAWQYRGEQVASVYSPYGRLVVMRERGQLAFYVNGVPSAYSDNTSAREEAVHYAMAQHPNPKKVLIVSGAITGSAREMLRYPVEVTCVEVDARVVAAVRQLRPDDFFDARLRLVFDDARRFVQRMRDRFDVVVLDLPDPSTLQLNRFFTVEFFAEVKRVLAPGGVLSFGLGHYENVVSRELADLLSSAQASLRTSFAHVRAIPGERVWFVASDEPIDADIAQQLEARGMTTQFVNGHFLAAALSPDRLADLKRAMAKGGAVNRDFEPVLYYDHLRRWLGQFDASYALWEAVLLLAFASYLVFVPALPRVIFVSGFAASALEVVLLLAFQICYGSAYRQIGLLIAAFMAGLAAGAVWAERRGATTDFRLIVVRLGFATAAIAVAFGLLLPQLRAFDAALGAPWVGQGIILLLAAALGASVGGQFPPAGAASSGSTLCAAARLLGADLAGASAGALLVSAWLIPALGVATVCLLSAAMSIGAAALLLRQVVRCA